MKIGTRLGGSFLLVTLLACALIAASLFTLAKVGRHWTDFSDTVLSKQDYATQGYIKLGDGVQSFKNYVVRGKDYDKHFLADMDAIARVMTEYRKLGVDNPKEEELLKKISAGERNYREAVSKVQGMKAAGTSVSEIDASISGADKVLGEGFAGLLEIARENASGTSREISSAIRSGQFMELSVGAVVLLLATLLAMLATHSITRPIREAVTIAKTVASGDLGSRIEVTRKDETGELLQALKEMNISLQRVVGGVRAGSDTIVTASTQIAGGNIDLAARTEQQASSLEETAAAMEQITSTVRRNADHARQANAMAGSVSDVASRSGLMVSDVVSTMDEIQSSAREIAEIISVIDGIAFQTNILALNAAVEAARAGEQGRGFAVVASEVRSLAQRSATAAKEIKDLIVNSVEKVEAGSQLVRNAGETIEELVVSVRSVTQIMSEISAASSEQEAGIEQVNQAIVQMDTVTQQNAALVEEAAAATEALKQQASRLAESVSVFRLGGRTV